MCEPAARVPAWVRPLLTATIGFVREIRRARRGELARVPERLEVQEDHVGVGVVLPVLEEVVAAHIGLVANRHERRDAEPQLGGLAEQLDPERARL